jgi:uncharacterized protein YndB with AHSA1/START domain
MPSASRSRTIAAPAEELWEVISDPHHLPRWWPRVSRVEDVEGDAFTEVMKTAKGKLVHAEGMHSLAWEQQLEGTPFARLMSAAVTRVSLQGAADGTSVTLELHQSLNGFFPRFGGFMVRRAAAATLEEALDGLERISG